MGKGRKTGAKSAITIIDCRRMGALAILLTESIFVWSVLSPSHNLAPAASRWNSSPAVHQPATESSFLSQPAELDKNDRLLYPYSVIPGGAKNGAELRSAVAHDNVVAKHYSDFELQKIRVVHLSEAKAVFVSYRVGNRIFWTKNRMTLPEGEAVLTDGVHMARTRCGNRLSDVPGEPVLKADPSPDAMEVPAVAGPFAVPVAPLEIPLGPPPTTGIVVPATAPGSIFIPPIPPVFPIGGSTPFPPGVPSSPPPPSGGPPSPPLGPPPPPPPPLATPEPPSLLMLTAGLACIWRFRPKGRA